MGGNSVCDHGGVARRALEIMDQVAADGHCRAGHLSDWALF